MALPIGLGGLALAGGGIYFLRGAASTPTTAKHAARQPLQTVDRSEIRRAADRHTVLATLALQFGNATSTYLLAAISGIADVDAITLSMSQVG